MKLLNRLAGFQRAPAGLEWRIWKRLPAITMWGTALPLAAGVLLWWLAPAAAPGSDDQVLMLRLYQLAGLVVLHWTLVLTAAIGCVIVMLMKGPAFVADAYPLPRRDPPSADD
jgi:hypothetical protein